MFDRFTAARLKIERANKHIAEFEKLVDKLKNSYTATVKRYELIRCQVIEYALPDISQFDAPMALILVPRAVLTCAWVKREQGSVPGAA